MIPFSKIEAVLDATTLTELKNGLKNLFDTDYNCVIDGVRYSCLKTCPKICTNKNRVTFDRMVRT